MTQFGAAQCWRRIPEIALLTAAACASIAKTVAELASQQNGLIHQQLIEQLLALRWRVSP